MIDLTKARAVVAKMELPEKSGVLGNIGIPVYTADQLRECMAQALVRNWPEGQAVERAGLSADELADLQHVEANFGNHGSKVYTSQLQAICAALRRLVPAPVADVEPGSLDALRIERGGIPPADEIFPGTNAALGRLTINKESAK